MPDAIVAAAFKNIYETVDITLDIRMRIGDGLADSSLGSEIHHHIKVPISKKHLHGLRVF